ncbi:MAG: hypothetical protein ACLGIN_18160 [Candidatus Sericytochromatia bacterium]
MDIRRVSLEPLRPQPLRAPQPGAGPERREGRGGDRFDRAPRGLEDEPPFWVVAMAADRMSRRQYLSAAERKAASRLEAAWVTQLAAKVAPAIADWRQELSSPPRLADWQALAEVVCEAAGQAPPRVVWQPGMRSDRGQFLFRVEGNLIQLRPGAPGTIAEWAGTVTHETYHHLQQEWVSALYRGSPALAGEADRLARYFRDARSVYQGLGPACPPARHRAQDLERGAWAFGGAIARQLEGG